MRNYKLALEYYNRAFRMEVELGPSNHSIEYDDLKDDLKKLLKEKLHMDKELEKYRRMFKVRSSSDRGLSDNNHENDTRNKHWIHYSHSMWKMGIATRDPCQMAVRMTMAQKTPSAETRNAF